MTGKRKAISQKIRFEVFKRDKFTCQYCGAKAPDVVLQVDHIEAVAKGGKNDILNLLTSCKACNGGKGARALSDDSALERQRAQLAELEERRQQIEMMVQWKNALAQQDDTLVIAYEAEVDRLTGFTLSEAGKAKARQAIRKYGFSHLIDALRISVDTYGRRDDNAKVTQASTEIVLEKARSIAANLKAYGHDPQGADFAYIQGILRNRVDDRWLNVIAELRNFRDEGLSPEYMKAIAKRVDSMSEFDELCWKEVWRKQKGAQDGGQ